MPGIAGTVSFAGSSPSAEDVRRLIAPLGGGPREHAVEAGANGPAAMAHAALSRSPWPPSVATSADGRIIAVVDGEFLGPFGDASQSHSSSGGGSDVADALARAASPAAFALARFEAAGIDFVAGVTGFFSLAIWDGRDETLWLANDRSALRPLYWTTDAGRALFASEAKVIARADGFTPEADRHGISDFIVFGFPLMERTLLAGVRALLPASIVRIRKGDVEQRRYWRLVYEWDAAKRYHWRDWVKPVTERFLDTFDEMLREPGPYAVPLSGGLDSRCIAAAMARAGRETQTFTIGSDGSADAILGAETARRLGMSNRAWRLEPANVVPWLPHAIYLTDGMFSAIDTHIIVIARHLPPELQFAIDGTSSYDGMYSGVDILRRRRLGTEYPTMKQVDWVFTHPLFDGDRNLTMQDLFTPAFRPEVAANLQTSLDELLAFIPSEVEDPFDRTDVMEQTQRVRRYNMMGTVLLRNFIEVRHAFFHPNLIDLLRRIPPSLRCKEKPITSRMIRAIDDRLADLPYERTGIRPDASAARIAAAYAKKFAKKTLAKAGVKTKRRGQAVDYQQWMENEPTFQAFFRDALLDSRSLARGYFDRGVLQKLLDDQIAGRASSLPFLSRLTSLEYFHRYLLEGETPGAWPG